VNLNLWVAKRGKESQTLDVIHVQVRQQDVHATQGIRERHAEPADASARI
jgi:hypothetical protein